MNGAYAKCRSWFFYEKADGASTKHKLTVFYTCISVNSDITVLIH